MGLFDRYRIDLTTAEALLGRPLRGDPSEGEIAVLCSLAAGRLGEARARLRGAGVSEAFRALVTERFAAAAPNATCQTTLPAAAYHFYRARAESEGRSLSDVLAAALVAASG